MPSTSNSNNSITNGNTSTSNTSNTDILTTTTTENTLQKNLQLYLDSMDEKDFKAYTIAKSHLGSSFQLEKSNGFIEWLKEQK